MDLIWIIYFIDVLSSDGSYGLLAFLMFISGGALAGFRAANHEHYNHEDEGSKWYKGKRMDIPYSTAFKTQITAFFVLVILEFIIPTKDTMYKMLAAYGVSELSQIDSAQRLGGKSIEVLEKVLDDYLEESESK